MGITAVSIFTIIYNLIEGVVSIYFGVQDEAVSLWGFGVDSFIEAFSAFIVLLHFSEKLGAVRAAKGISILFFALAAVTVFAAVNSLRLGNHPDATLPGTIIAIVSLIVMFFIYKIKLDLGRKHNSQIMLHDAACAKACMQLSGVLLAGSAIYALFPHLWWVDAVGALGIAYLIAKEGRCMWADSDHSHAADSCCD